MSRELTAALDAIANLPAPVRAKALAADNLAERVDAALLAAGSTGERQVWFTRAEAARAVRDALITAQGEYTTRAKAWREYGDGMHRRAMRVEAALCAIGDFAHDKSTGPAVPDALWEVRGMAYDAGKP